DYYCAAWDNSLSRNWVF
nr:immunoglobulin light chain junction region [Macaca mulatta]